MQRTPVVEPVTDAGDVQRVTVQGRPAQIAAGMAWVVSGNTASGSAFRLVADRERLTREQVLELAESIRG